MAGGIESAPQQSINAGIGVEPLTTQMAPVVTPNAVAALADAFRQGFITTQDIQDRVGELGQTRRKAEITGLKEQLAPTAVEARQSLLKAASAKAALEQSTAEAAQGNVAGAAGLSAEQIAAQRQLLPAQTALTSKQLELNAQFLFPKAIYDIATSRLKGTPVESVDPKTGTPMKQMFNELGEDVTPPAGNYAGAEDFHRYSRLAQSAFSHINLGQAEKPMAAPAVTASMPGVQPPAPPAVSPAIPATPPSPFINPSEPLVSEAAPVDQQRADLLKSGKFDIHEIDKMSDADIIDSHKHLVRFAAPVSAPPVVQPTQPQAAVSSPVIEPAGIQTGMAKNFMTGADIGTDLRKQSAYTQWDQQKGFAQSFETAADKINKIPVSDQRSGSAKMNALDMSLAESIIKMYDPGMAIREFKWSKLAEAQPYLERLPNWRAEWTHTGSLTPEGRQRLIEMGYDSIAGKEKAVVPHIQLAAQRATQNGVKPSDVLNPDELRVLAGKTFGTPPGSPGTAPQGKTSYVPGVGTGILDPRTGVFTITR